MQARGPQLSAPFRGHPPQIHSQIHTHVLYTCKQHFVIGFRIRAHVLLNLWRLCIMLESVEIMQGWDIMPPFPLIASVLFPCLCCGEYPTYFILFSSLILNLIFFSLSSQFPSVVLHPPLFSFILHSPPSSLLFLLLPASPP